MEGNAVQFAQTARALAEVAHRLGLAAPGYRSPPRKGAGHRTIRRSDEGTATVSVVVRDRPWPAVVADMVDGVVVVNHLEGEAAGEARDALWAAVAGQLTTTEGRNLDGAPARRARTNADAGPTRSARPARQRPVRALPENGSDVAAA